MSGTDHRARLLRAMEYRQEFDDRLGHIERQTPFDSIHDVETADPVELWELPDADQSWVGRNARYSPTPVRTVRNALRRCAVRHEDMTFVDVGCGKGRVLLLATEFPFRRIVGVEVSQALCDIAKSNVEKASRTRSGCERISVVHADATAFDIPRDAGLFYFYEPFAVDVSMAVLEHIEGSIRRHPRRVVLCFTGRGQPDGNGSPEAIPVAAAAAESRAAWSLVEVVPSPDAEGGSPRSVDTDRYAVSSTLSTVCCS
ncbi:class I SAM-dependent methyltransferase [Streptosporangium fragile]